MGGFKGPCNPKTIPVLVPPIPTSSNIAYKSDLLAVAGAGVGLVPLQRGVGVWGGGREVLTNRDFKHVLLTDLQCVYHSFITLENLMDFNAEGYSGINGQKHRKVLVAIIEVLNV